MELFDTTDLRRAESLRRHVADAAATGQGDLFGALAEVAEFDTAVEVLFVWPSPVGALFTREDATGAMMLA